MKLCKFKLHLLGQHSITLGWKAFCYKLYLNE